MPDPIEELENFSIPGPAMTPLPAAEVRRRGNRIRRRNNALAAAGGLAVVAAIAVPFAVFAGNQTSSTEPPQPAPSSVDWRTTIPASFDLTAVPAGTPIAFDLESEPVVAEVVCGNEVFSTESAADSATVTYREENTESSAARALAVYADEQEARRALATFRQGVESCPTDDENEGVPLEYALVSDAPASAEDGFVYSEQAHDGDLYYDLSVVEVARVGNAIFVGSTQGGPGGSDLVADGMVRLGDLSEPVLAQMCVFSATGCGTGDQAEDPAIPADFPIDEGLPTGGLDGTVPSPDPTATCEHPAERPKPVERAHAQWRSISEIRDRQLLTFSTEAEAEEYVEAVSTVDCSPNRVTTVSNYLDTDAMVAIGHNENAGTVEPGLVLTYVARVGRAVLLAQRIDEGYTWTDVQQETSTLADDTGTELVPLVAAMCAFTETGC